MGTGNLARGQAAAAKPLNLSISSSLLSISVVTVHSFIPTLFPKGPALVPPFPPLSSEVSTSPCEVGLVKTSQSTGLQGLRMTATHKNCSSAPYILPTTTTDAILSLLTPRLPARKSHIHCPPASLAILTPVLIPHLHLCLVQAPPSSVLR